MSHLLTTAPRLAASGLAYVTLRNGSRALIVPPGTTGQKICVRLIDASGKPSATVKLIPVKYVRLEDLPAPPLAICAPFAGCGAVADRFDCRDAVMWAESALWGGGCIKGVSAGSWEV